MSKKEYDVIIVGAGISGLSAAYEAKQKGLTYKVIEARDRTGGRILTEKIKHGLVIERGAEWIGKTHKDLLAFCKKQTLQLESHRYSKGRYFTKTGNELTTIDSLFSRFEKRVKAMRISDVSPHEDWYSFLKGEFTEEELRIISFVYSSEFGSHARYLDAKDVLKELQSGGGNDHLDYHIKGGSSKLIETLVKEVGKKNISLNEPVRTIQDTKNQVVIQTSKGTLCAKRVILTVPTASLKKLKISPSLKNKRVVANNLKYCDITKAFLSFTGDLPFRKQGFAMFSESDFHYTYVATQGQSEKHFALCIFSTGAAAKKVFRMKSDVLEKKLKALLPRDVFNIEQMKLNEVVVQNWGSDEYVKGAYAVFNPGEMEKVHQAFDEPHGNIYFAGEHLGEFYGFMNGAFQSGRDVMKQVIKSL